MTFIWLADYYSFTVINFSGYILFRLEDPHAVLILIISQSFLEPVMNPNSDRHCSFVHTIWCLFTIAKFKICIYLSGDSLGLSESKWLIENLVSVDSIIWRIQDSDMTFTRRIDTTFQLLAPQTFIQGLRSQNLNRISNKVVIGILVWNKQNLEILVNLRH